MRRRGKSTVLGTQRSQPLHDGLQGSRGPPGQKGFAPTRQTGGKPIGLAAKIHCPRQVKAVLGYSDAVGEWLQSSGALDIYPAPLEQFWSSSMCRVEVVLTRARAGQHLRRDPVSRLPKERGSPIPWLEFP